MPDWNQLIRIIPDELGGWDVEVDRDTWRALLQDASDALLEEGDDEEEEGYGREYDWPSSPELQEAEEAERQAHLARAARWRRAFPRGWNVRIWPGHTGRTTIGRKFHRLRFPVVDDWDPVTEGSASLCGVEVPAGHIGNHEPDCASCDLLLRGQAELASSQSDEEERTKPDLAGDGGSAMDDPR